MNDKSVMVSKIESRRQLTSRVYSLLVSVTVWTLLIAWTFLQIVGRRSTWSELRQRLGWTRFPAKAGRVRLLLHGVSVGEIKVGGVILEELVSRMPDLEIVLSTGNRNGWKAAERIQQRLPEIVQVCFLPWDRAAALYSWLENLEPDLVAVVETEIWPNLFFNCEKLGIPLVILNGRISPRDVPRYALAYWFFRRVLSSVQWIGVQNAAERERFLRIGARPEQLQVAGNAKFDLAESQVHSFAAGKARRFQAPVLVAGSSHRPEEKWLLASLVRLRKVYPALRLVLAPRHTPRVPTLERLVRGFGLIPLKWSDLGQDASPWDVLLVDEMGYLPDLYRHADLVVVGGSLAKCGGQNLLEAAAHRRAIVAGPHVFHFQEIVEELYRAGGIVWLQSRRDLHAALRRLLENEKERERLGQKAYLFLQSRRGAAAKYCEALTRILKSALHQGSASISSI